MRRPIKRARCAVVPRPCPFANCRYHLALDVTDGGKIRYNHPDTQLDRLEPSCALDVAEQQGGLTVAELAAVMGTTYDEMRAELDATLDKVRSVWTT